MAKQFKYTSNIQGTSSGAGATAGRAKHGLVSLYMDTKGLQGGIRDLLGRFTSAQSLMADVNRKLALQLAETIAEQLESGLFRPGSSTGRLKEVVLSPKNRRSDQFSYGVGIISFMDQSDAKYWRAIESGTRHFVGKTIFGLWSSSIEGFVSPGGAYGPYPAAQPNYSIAGQGAGQRLRPMTRSQVYRQLRRQGVASKLASRAAWPKKAPTIKRPIRAEHYFETGFKEFDAPARTLAAIQEVFREQGLPVPKPR